MKKFLLHIFGALLLVVSMLGVSIADTDPLERRIAAKCRSSTCVDPDVLAMAIFKASEETGVNPRLLLAIVESESSYSLAATNRSNGRSVGLLQIQVRWHKDKFRSKDRYDVFDNVYVGALIYRDCLNKWRGSREKALWCYNGHQKSGMKKYVQKVLLTYSEISRLGVFRI